ncbi:MAG: acetate--CoA ligase family protein [Candidatus Helarchaeota archaeon]
MNVSIVDQLKKFFEPNNGIAVIGASEVKGKVGNAVLKNLISGSVKKATIKFKSTKSEGFKGPIYPINVKISNGQKILGLPAYRSVLDIPGEVDCAVIAIPSKFVLNTIHECGKKGIKALVIITAGFSEIGGKDAEAELVKTAQQYGIRIIGPNCLGIMRTHNNLNASFSDFAPPKGPIAFISQSGALCTAVINYSYEEAIGFSNFVSIGNKSDISDADLLYYFLEDEMSKVISIYIESIPDGDDFIESVKKVIKKKPIVVYKAGRTSAGAAAASSHTGSIAGSDTIYDSLFRQLGVYRTSTMNELFDCSKALGYQPPARGDRVAIVTNAGGPGVMAADEVYMSGLKLADVSDDVMDELNSFLPKAWSHRNPIDILGDAMGDRYERALELVADDPNNDAIIVILCPTAMVEPMKTAKVVVELNEKIDKPISCAWLGMESRMSSYYLDEHGLPELSFPQRCVKAIKSLVERGKFLQKHNIKF